MTKFRLYKNSARVCADDESKRISALVTGNSVAWVYPRRRHLILYFIEHASDSIKNALASARGANVRSKSPYLQVDLAGALAAVARQVLLHLRNDRNQSSANVAQSLQHNEC